MEALVKLTSLPVKTEEERDAYLAQCRKYLKERRRGMKLYIDSIRDAKKNKLPSSHREYMKLLADVSFIIDMDMNGLHDHESFEHLCDILEKVKKHECFKNHDRVVPASVEKLLSTGQKELLSDLVAEFDAMKAPGSWEDTKPVEDSKSRAINILQQDRNTYVRESEYSFIPSVRTMPYLADRSTAGSRFMEYMGMGQNTNKSDIAYTTDAKGRRHWGFNRQKNHSRDHTWYTWLCDDYGTPGIDFNLVYSPEAIRQMSNLSLLLALMGRTNFDPTDQYTMMFSEQLIQKQTDKGKRTVDTNYYVSGVYFNTPDECFTLMTADELKKGKGSLPSFENIDIPFLDEEFVDKVLALKAEDLYKITGGLLEYERVECFGERLAHIQAELKKRKAQDRKLPEKDRTILKQEDWERTDVRAKLETGLKNENKQLFPDLLMGDTRIEGALHEGLYGVGDPDEEFKRQSEQEYFRIYDSIKAEYREADTYDKKVELLINCNWRMNAGKHIDDENIMIINEAMHRVLEEEADREFLTAFLRRKTEVFVRVAELVQAKVDDPDFVVPPEAENALNKKSAKNTARVRQEYAALIARQENPDLFAEASALNALSGHFSETSFTSKSLDDDMDTPLYALLDIEAELSKGDKKLKAKNSLGSEIAGSLFGRLDRDLVAKMEKEFHEFHTKKNDEYMKRFEGVM